MSRAKADPDREHRIEQEIVVDAYDAEERAMSWYYYLQENLRFPFTAACDAKRPISPLRKGDEVEVIGMAPEDECGREMLVMIRWEKGGLAVPLSQLRVPEPIDAATRQAVEDWAYWVGMGHEF